MLHYEGLMKQEDLQDYLKRSGDTKITERNLIENEHGFMTWAADEDTLIPINVYGDGKYWDNFLVILAKELGLKKIQFGTERNYKAYERRFGYKLKGYILEKEVK